MHTRQQLVDDLDLAARAGLPQPRCYVIPQASPNAFATSGWRSSSVSTMSPNGVLCTAIGTAVNRIDAEVFRRAVHEIGYFEDDRVDEPAEFAMRGRVIW